MGRAGDVLAAVYRAGFEAPLRGRGYGVYCAAVAAALVAYFALGAKLVNEANLEWNRSDQDANMNAARLARGDWFPHRTAVVQPLWPWLAARVHHEDPDVFFRRGKWLNMGLTAGFFAVLALVAGRVLAPVPATILSAVAGFGVWLQRAHYFQPEPMLFGWFLLAFFGMAGTLAASRWWLYAATGLALGLVMLTKASAEPLVAVYLVAGVIRLVLWVASPGRAGSAWHPARHAAGLAVVAATAGCVAGPMLVFNRAQHGNAFHSLPKYYAWLESWDDEAMPMTPTLNDPTRLAQLPAKEVPGAANYIARYGWEHAGERFLGGVAKVFQNFAIPPGRLYKTLWPRIDAGSAGEPRRLSYILPARGIYALAAYGLAVAMGMAALFTRDGRAALTPGLLCLGAMATGVFLAYLFGYGWYERIGRGERFMLLVLLPLLGSSLWIGERLARASSFRLAKVAYATVLVLMLSHIALQAAIVFVHPHFKAVT